MKEERMNLYRQSIIVGALKGDELDMRAMLGMDLAYKELGRPTFQQLLEQHLEENPDSPDKESINRVLKILRAGEMPSQ